jgi:hypothetical protein
VIFIFAPVMARFFVSKEALELYPDLMQYLVRLCESISLSDASAVFTPKSGCVVELAMLLKEKSIPYHLDMNDPAD